MVSTGTLEGVGGRAEGWRLRVDGGAALMAAASGLLALLVILPFGWLAYFAFTSPDGALTLANFTALVTDPSLAAPIRTTAILATSVALASMAVAMPLAWLVARTDIPARRTIRILMTASFVTPPFLGAIAWEILAAPNSGILNRLWRDLSGAEVPLFNIYSLSGLIFVIACYTTPFVFVLLANALDRIPAELEDAAGILGARPLRILRDVTLPLVLPAILAGALIAFLQAMVLFGSPAILALPAGFHTITTKIFMLFQFPPKPHVAAAAALPLLAVTVLLLWGQRRLMGRRQFTVIGGKGGTTRRVALGRWRYAALAFALGVLAFPVFLPYAALLKAAATRVASDPLSWSTLTWFNVHFVFYEFSQTIPAIWNTLILAASAATLGALLAFAIAWLVSRSTHPGRHVVEFLVTAPVAIPGIVLGVGLFLAYARPPLMLYGTLWILFLAYLTIELPPAFQQMRSAFRAVHPELEEASRILGGTRLTTLWRISEPLVRPALVSAWCFIFIGVVRELSAAIMLFTARTKVLSVVIYDLNESGDLGAIAVLGITMLVGTLAIVAFASRLAAAPNLVQRAG
ncbi:MULTISPECIES: iron ABC transporter permease [Rhodomicrobium]|uniref:ABC transporter permease n=1 Tax=Rhodomicrobium TaxID=1068 RepID=UPI001FD8A4DC|nr:MULTISPECIES: iron ABC transporter permease [Rhodomicrobium]